MRKLKQIVVVHGNLGLLLALDDNGELWHGVLETTDDGRRVIDWTPVNTPKDGAAFTEPQMNFFDKWEREARERLKEADTQSIGEDVPLAAEAEDVANRSGNKADDPSDDSVENGEGIDPAVGSSAATD